jgi:hypothetical protein
MNYSSELRSRNTPSEVTFIIWCIALFMAFWTGYNNLSQTLSETFSKLNLKDGIFMIMSPFIVYIFTGYLSGLNKARLIFWRWKYPLPGSRVFTEADAQDQRIRTPELKVKLKELPTDPEKQNALWYKQYRKYADCASVQQTHQTYLLLTDFAVISLFFLIAGTIVLIATKHYSINGLYYSLVMLVHFVMSALAARSYGFDFVHNVLVEVLMDEKT